MHQKIYVHHIRRCVGGQLFDGKDATTSCSKACSRSAQCRLAVKSIVLLQKERFTKIFLGSLQPLSRFS